MGQKARFLVTGLLQERTRVWKSWQGQGQTEQHRNRVREGVWKKMIQEEGGGGAAWVCVWGRAQLGGLHS